MKGIRKHMKVLDYVAEEFNLEPKFYKNKSRLKQYSLAKKMSCWVLYHSGGLSMPEIGRIMGYAEHTTALYHIHDYWYMCRSDDEFKAKGEKIYSKSIEIYETN